MANAHCAHQVRKTHGTGQKRGKNEHMHKTIDEADLNSQGQSGRQAGRMALWTYMHRFVQLL